MRFVPGFFEATLPPLAGGQWAIVRLDADTYAPTRQALRCLYPGLAPGGYLILDDYGSFPGCREAVDEFRAEHGITEPIEKVDPDLRALAARERCADRDRSRRRARRAAALDDARARHPRADRARGRARPRAGRGRGRDRAAPVAAAQAVPRAA